MKRINFDLGELHAFVVTAERASFRAAAELLHLSQPALSRRVERLESALGARLLQRSTRHVELTALGAEFLQEARAALSSLEEAVQRIDDQNHLRRGRVTVACVPSVATHLLPRLLKEYAHALPDVQIHVIDESASQVLEAVARGEADFGLSFTGSQDAQLHFEPLKREHYVLAMPRDHAWARRASIAWAELAGHRLVSVSHSSSNRILLDQALSDLPERPMAWYECNHVNGALALVEAGLGMAPLPQLAIPPQQSAVCGVSLTDPVIWRTLGLIRRRDHHLSPPAQRLWDQVLATREVSMAGL